MNRLLIISLLSCLASSSLFARDELVQLRSASNSKDYFNLHHVVTTTSSGSVSTAKNAWSQDRWVEKGSISHGLVAYGDHGSATTRYSTCTTNKSSETFTTTDGQNSSMYSQSMWDVHNYMGIHTGEFWGTIALVPDEGATGIDTMGSYMLNQGLSPNTGYTEGIDIQAFSYVATGCDPIGYTNITSFVGDLWAVIYPYVGNESTTYYDNYISDSNDGYTSTHQDSDNCGSQYVHMENDVQVDGTSGSYGYWLVCPTSFLGIPISTSSTCKEGPTLLVPTSSAGTLPPFVDASIPPDDADDGSDPNHQFRYTKRSQLGVLTWFNNSLSYTRRGY